MFNVYFSLIEVLWFVKRSRPLDDDTCTSVGWGGAATWMMSAMLNVFLFQVLISRPKRVIGELAQRDGLFFLHVSTLLPARVKHVECFTVCSSFTFLFPFSFLFPTNYLFFFKSIYYPSQNIQSNIFSYISLKNIYFFYL